VPPVSDSPIPSALVPLAGLSAQFRDNADTARRLTGSNSAALVWEEAAQEVEERLGKALLELLTLDAAAAESGYTCSHLRRLLREGTIPDAGTEQDPRILRMHLPRKPGHGVDADTVRPASSRVQAARAVIEGEQ